MRKSTEFVVELDADLRDAFLAEAASADQPASQLVRHFIREFIAGGRKFRNHDAWFREQVQQALDDPRPSIPHRDVMKEVRAIADRLRPAS